MIQKQTPPLPLVLLFVLLIPCWGIAWKPGGDLGVYYKASSWLLNGWVLKLYTDNAEIGNFFYGPFGLALLKPLSLLSFTSANYLWLLLQTVAYLWFWRNLFLIFPELTDRKHWKLFLLVWIVSIKPIHASFQSHNVQLMFAALLSECEIALRSNKKSKNIIGGSVVTLLASIKIYPSFLAAYYFFKRKTFFTIGLILGVLASLVVPMFVFGFSTGASLPLAFVENARKYHAVYDLAKDVVSLSLPSLLATWLPKSLLNQGAIGFTVATISIMLFSWIFLKSPQLKIENERFLWAFVWSMMGLLNSTTRPDYFIFFVPAFASLPLMIESKPKKLLFQLGISISVVLIAFITEWTLGSRDLTHYLEGLRVPVLGILLLCYMQFVSIRNILDK